LLNKISNVLCIICIVLFFEACQTKQKSDKFDAPVEEIVQLNNTKIGLSTVASDIEVPWDIEWGQDGDIWFTIQKGLVKKVNPHTGEIKSLLNLKVYTRTTPGLLGMDVYSHVDKNFVFLIYTHKNKEAKITLRLERYTIADDSLVDPLVLREIPGGKSHNGSRVAISPDGKVFWATGDIAVHGNAQSLSSPNGKVLRLNMDGSIPEDNPYPDKPVWALGFRAPEGLTFTPHGKLFLSTHGPASDDEVNLI